ncbi:MAG: lysozyme inhibitor LprI family protein [Rhizomicrobium sp.]
MRTQFLTVGVCATLALCGPAWAGEASSRVFADCAAQSSNGSDSSEHQLLRCAGLQLDALEQTHTEAYKAALERARRYQAAKAVITSGQKPSDTLLREAQRKWIEFRDANCAVHVDATSAGGSARTEDTLACRIDTVSLRTEELNQLYR